MDLLHFELVTPAKLALSTQVHMVTSPGSEGEFGVMAGHAPFISTLKPGALAIYSADNTVAERLFITGGVAEVTPEKGLTVLAEQVIDLKGLTRADAESRLNKARAAADAAITDEQKRDAQTELKLAEALLAAI